jgi:hypothetical protein
LTEWKNESKCGVFAGNNSTGGGLESTGQDIGVVAVPVIGGTAPTAT